MSGSPTRPLPDPEISLRDTRDFIISSAAREASAFSLANHR